MKTVIADQTGEFFHAQTETALLSAIEKAAAAKWNSAAIRANAERFSEANFIAGLTASIARCMGT